jgi:hypothetical protein
MKKIFILLLFVVVLYACAQGQPAESAIQTAIAQTEASKPTEVPQTNTPEDTPTDVPTLTYTPNPTNTPRSTNTPRPTNTPAPTATPTQPVDPSLAIAKNYVASQDSGGVIVEVARVLIADKAGVSQDFSEITLLQDKTTVVEFIFKVINNTDQIVRIHVYASGQASINGEPVIFDDYSWLNDSDTWFGDDLSEDFLPGGTTIGGFWAGIKRSQWDEITSINIKIDAPFDDDYRSIGPDYYFEIPVDGWTFEEIPDELK